MTTQTQREVHTDSLNKRKSGTGQWFIESSEFKSFTDGQSNTLFCPGIPGAGKTVIASLAIDYLQSIGKCGNTAVTYIFCSYARREEQTADTHLRTILRHLAEQSETLPDVVVKLHNEKSRKVLHPLVEDVKEAIDQIIKIYERVFVVIDALDEAAEDVRDTMIDTIQTLQKTSNVAFLATSRPMEVLERPFGQSPRLEIKAADADIQSYLDDPSTRFSNCIMDDAQLLHLVKTTICEAVSGM